MKISLDLLPQNKKIEIKRQMVFREIIFQGVLFLFPILVLIVILINVYYLMSIQKNIDFAAYDAEQAQDKYQELNRYEEDFKRINEVSSLLIKIQGGHLHWTKVLGILGQSVPDGISISSLVTKNYSVFLVGKAKTRDKLLEFKDNLGKNECFENINVPLSDLVVKENVEFQIDFSIKQTCLKGQ